MSNQNNPGDLSEGQRKLIEQLKADGDASPTFTQEEKLALVASELMAPEEVGLSSAEDARLELMPEAEKEAILGDALQFQCGVVPIELRAEWARQELKIVPTDISAWKNDWIDKNKDTFVIQGVMHCGTALAKFERTFSDPTLGLSIMLKLAGDMLEAKYRNTEIPAATDQVAPALTPNEEAKV